MSTRSISTRVPVAAEARRRNVTESDLIREILAARYLGARPSAKEPVLYDGQRMDGYAQLIFEIAKTRSVVLHSLDHTLRADLVDEIIEAAHCEGTRRAGAQDQGGPVMTPAIRQAIHERALLASLELRLREALRYVLLTAALWAEMTLCLVWHWTGRYGGPAAHRYFIEGFLAWFLTQKIPLTFASLPYRGGRYTITSMYTFLNYKHYLGGSFGSWYWHYAAWGAVLTGLIEAAVVALLYVRTGRSEAVHIRGITLVPARKLARKLGGRAGIRAAGIRIPRA